MRRHTTAHEIIRSSAPKWLLIAAVCIAGGFFLNSSYASRSTDQLFGGAFALIALIGSILMWAGWVIFAICLIAVFLISDWAYDHIWDRFRD
jgi:hypothetical protein